MIIPLGRGILFLGIFIGLCLAGFAFIAQAQGSGIPVTGYAWSSNIGWISMSCQDGGAGQSSVCASNGGFDYGVFVNPDGTLSGYAWSSNIGWIQFGGLAGCPAGNCDARLNGDASELLGWARALSYGGGWDGWISLSCSNTGGCGGPGGSNYKVRVNNISNSFAWGGDVVGWTDFSQVSIPLTPAVTLTASPNPIPYNTAADLTWTVEGFVTSCDATGVWFGPRAPDGGPESTGNLTADSFYQLECFGPSGSDSASVVVDVIQPPTADLNVCRWDGSVASDCIGTDETLLIAEGDEIRVIWDGGTEATTTCSGTGKDFDTGGGRSGAVTIGSLTVADSIEEYRVTCTNISGSSDDQAFVDIGNACDPYDGLDVPDLVRQGSSFTLSWQKPVDKAECVVSGGSVGITASSSEPASGQCDIIDEFPVSIENNTQFTMSCNYPTDPPEIVDVIPRIEEI